MSPGATVWLRRDPNAAIAPNPQEAAPSLWGSVGSVVRRAPGFDVPEFLAAGPRHVLVAASDVAVAQDGLREDDPGKSEPSSRSGADRRSRVIAGLLIPVAPIVLVICLETDVLF